MPKMVNNAHALSAVRQHLTDVGDFPPANPALRLAGVLQGTGILQQADTLRKSASLSVIDLTVEPHPSGSRNPKLT
jgi:hypothetical protein